MMRVTRDAHHLHRAKNRPTVRRRFERAADRVLTWPQPRRERVIHDGHRPCALAILRREPPATGQLDPHRLEKVRPDLREVASDAQLFFTSLQLGLRRSLANVKDRSPASVLDGWNRGRPAGYADAWCVLERFRQCLEESRRSLR